MNNNKIIEQIYSSSETILANLSKGVNLSNADLNILHFVSYNLEKIKNNTNLEKKRLKEVGTNK